MGKGEIAHNEQFFLFPQCLQEFKFCLFGKGLIKGKKISVVKGENAL